MVIYLGRCDIGDAAEEDIYIFVMYQYAWCYISCILNEKFFTLIMI